jgi:hypothetical protein
MISTEARWQQVIIREEILTESYGIEKKIRCLGKPEVEV